MEILLDLGPIFLINLGHTSVFTSYIDFKRAQFAQGGIGLIFHSIFPYVRIRVLT